MHIAHVVVDGSNIATEARSLPSLAQLDEAVKAFLAEFEVDNLTVIVDATFGHRIDASERAEFDQAIANAELVTPPAGAIGRGDAFVLQIANRVDAVVLSNDSFQEFHGEYPWLFDEGRLVGGKPVPGVGWVFLRRTPVRGPASRKSQREAKRKRTDTEGTSAEGTRRSRSARSAGARSTEKEKSTSGRTARKRTAEKSATKKTATKKSAGRAAKKGSGQSADTSGGKGSVTQPGGTGGGSGRQRRRGGGKPAAPVNETLPFLDFVADHPVGTEVEGEVIEYSSHGAYVLVGGLRCYAPLHALGDPPPQRARDVLGIGEIHRFEVTELDAPRRGIDVGLLPDSLVRGAQQKGEPASKRANARISSPSAPSVVDGVSSDGTTTPGGTAASAAVMLDLEEEQVAVKKASKKAAKRAPARKKAAKKAPARKKAAKKAPARKKAAKKAPARKKAAKKAPARKKAAKKAPARKKAAKKAPARKKAAKKAPARKKAAKRTARRR